jgi:transcriptional regulator with XRE-family HTH domain
VPTYSPHRQHPSLIALGNAIRGARLAQGLSQEELALKAEVDRTYLGRVERGDSVVAVLVLISIAKALGMSLERLCREAEL